MKAEELIKLLQEHKDANVVVCDVKWQTCGISGARYDDKYNRIMLDFMEEMP